MRRAGWETVTVNIKERPDSVALIRSLRPGSRDSMDLVSTERNSQNKNSTESSQNPKVMVQNTLLIGMLSAVILAGLFPGLGRNGGALRPGLFVDKLGVTYIFLLTGLSLRLSDLADALANVRLNLAIQIVAFTVWPFLVGVLLTGSIRRYLPELLPPALLDGVLALSCLPTTINLCMLLTSAVGGNVAAALCNAVLSNFIGIMVTPALLLRCFGRETKLPFFQMVRKLSKKVLLPVVIGQGLRHTKVSVIFQKNQKKFKKLQLFVLLSIVWHVFCNAFYNGLDLKLRHGISLLILLPLLHVGALFGSKMLFEIVARGKNHQLTRRDVTAAMFCASQKTLAFGLPLFQSVFEGSDPSNLAAYCAPIVILGPLQLIIGSFFVPHLSKYISEDPETSNATD